MAGSSTPLFTNTATSGSSGNVVARSQWVNAAGGQVQIGIIDNSDTMAFVRGGTNATFGKWSNSGLTMIPSTSGSASNYVGITSISGNSSGVQTGFNFSDTGGNTSTGGITGLLINLAGTYSGSGSQLLMDLQNGGTSRINTTINGTTTVTGAVNNTALAISNSVNGTNTTATATITHNWASSASIINGFVVNLASDTGGSGSNSTLQSWQVAGSDVVHITKNGTIIQSSGNGNRLTGGINTNYISSLSSSTGLVCQYGTTFSTANKTWFSFFADPSGALSTSTFTATSGQNTGVAILSTYNQITATTSNTDFLINRTETSLGSGTQLFADYQVAGTSRINFTNVGQLNIVPSAGTIKAISVTANASGDTRACMSLTNSNASGYATIDVTNSAGKEFVIGVGGPSVSGATWGNGANVMAYSTLTLGLGIQGNRILAMENTNGFINITPLPQTSVSGSFAVFALTPTYNQASGSAANTDILVNRTETLLGSGAQSFIDLQVAGTSALTINNKGRVLTGVGLVSSATGGYAFIGSTNSGMFRVSNDVELYANGTMFIQLTGSSIFCAQPLANINAATNAKVDLSANGAIISRNVADANLPLTVTNLNAGFTGGILNVTNVASTITSGSIYGLQVACLYNQGSGSAANYDFVTNRTETAIGSGVQRMYSGQVASVEKFGIDNKGNTGIGLSPTTTSFLSLAAATTAKSSLNIASGSAPTSPVNGDMWQASNHLYARLNGATYQLDQQGISGHTIFAPTTGGTVNLVNNQYNIINPAGALLALTVNLPSSPANDDRVQIKFTQTVTTVTYANGTVVDGITGPAAGGMVVLVYDNGTTSWY